MALLLELQDLRSQHRELVEGPGDDVETEHFNIDIEHAAELLESKIAEIEGQLTPAMRSRYQRVARSLGRVVVPVVNGVCCGCFVSIATARAGEPDPNDVLSTCEHCGRFIYIT